MTREDFLKYNKEEYNVSADYPFDDLFETAVLRHSANRKWYALVMKISRKRLGIDSDERVDVVNLKLPLEMFGSFGAADGVYPAYHMNKIHWVSVILNDAQPDLIEFLTGVSFELTKPTKKTKKTLE